jgi:hypothetical protein
MAQQKTQPSVEDLYAAFSSEELAEFLGATGQAANVRERTPILKINYCDIPDRNGKEIKKGNFVLGQNSSEVEVEVVDEEGNKSKEKRIEDIGIDLGKAPSITILLSGIRYAFYHSDKKKTCTSQITFDWRNDPPVGANLKHVCTAKTCPRRAKDIDRAEKCGCQHVIFCEVPLEDGAKAKAIMYAGGASYVPFDDYLKQLGVPVFMAPTKLSTTMEREGSVTYFIMGFEMQKNKPYEKSLIYGYRDLANATRTGVLTQRQQSARPQIADKSEGRNAVLLKDDDLTDIAFD